MFPQAEQIGVVDDDYPPALRSQYDDSVAEVLPNGNAPDKSTRMKRKTTVVGLAAVGLVLAALEQPVQAYLDPGSGSMLLQVLLGGFAAVGVATRLYWHRLTALFHRNGAERGRR